MCTVVPYFQVLSALNVESGYTQANRVWHSSPRHPRGFAPLSMTMHAPQNARLLRRVASLLELGNHLGADAPNGIHHHVTRDR